jgi:hypothetical protein
MCAQDHALRASTSRPAQLIAGFEVSINCRFWVSTEETAYLSAFDGLQQASNCGGINARLRDKRQLKPFNSTIIPRT